MSYTCPSEKIAFAGKCPVKTCPAWVKSTDSGCIYQNLPEVTKFSVGMRLDMTNAVIKKSYKRSMRRLTDLSKFYHLAYQNLVLPQQFCPHCGIGGKECLNKINCDNRKEFALRYTEKYPFKVLTNITLAAFWQLIFIPDLKEYIRPPVLKKAQSLCQNIKGLNNAQAV
jgi:hypothetical protein